MTRALHPGPPRVSDARAIEEIAAGAWSAPEARAATLLRRGHVPPFKQNRRIDLPSGKWYWADFIWAQLQAILEIDSRQYHSLPPDDEHTSDRQIELEILGYSVIHRTPTFIRHNPDRFVDEVSRWLAARASHAVR
jgi:very-short-patch-repair endonuclease